MIMNTSAEANSKRCSAFLKVADKFRLGDLITEKSNPLTQNLSFLANNDLNKAISVLKQVDIQALKTFLKYSQNLQPLIVDIRETLNSGNKIFLCGCGATGRLSIALEFIWRKINSLSKYKNSVIGFMAGGDVAIINSIEKFEDYPEFGARHLRELNFCKQDLFIGITEGGETPYVIGAIEEALRISARAPYFLYCNPDDILIKTVARSRNIINNKNIRKINLSVGPMAITGSTRMQASTVLMYAVGLCLFSDNNQTLDIKNQIENFIKIYENFDLSFIGSFINREAEIYRKGEYIYYETGPDYGITVLTDTTERSPTFSLIPFENQNTSIKDSSLCYLLFADSGNPEEAWFNLLSRKPRSLEWKNISEQTSEDWLYGFDFSNKLVDLRFKYLTGGSHYFRIYERSKLLKFELDELSYEINLETISFFHSQILLKLILNTLSTLIMGMLNRYEGNVMTWVRPSNNKLIDRTIRYIDLLIKKLGKSYSYEEIARTCFSLMPFIKSDESLVLATVDYLISSKG